MVSRKRKSWFFTRYFADGKAAQPSAADAGAVSQSARVSPTVPSSTKHESKPEARVKDQSRRGSPKRSFGWSQKNEIPPNWSQERVLSTYPHVEAQSANQNWCAGCWSRKRLSTWDLSVTVDCKCRDHNSNLINPSRQILSHLQNWIFRVLSNFRIELVATRLSEKFVDPEHASIKIKHRCKTVCWFRACFN